jgi:phospholipid transport system substrate-binding protein
MTWLKSVALILGLAVWPVAAAQAAASDPAAQRIENFYASLVDTMKHGSQLGIHGRYQAMTPAVDAAFDIPTMIKFICGPGWDAMSADDHKSLADAFRRMTIADYASNFEEFHGEQFNVEPNVQTRGTDRFVQSTLVPPGDKPVPFIYRMRETPAGWKIIDIYLNGYVSELATRRSDFASTLAAGGAPALARKLNEMADNLLSGVKTKAD